MKFSIVGASWNRIQWYESIINGPILESEQRWTDRTSFSDCVVFDTKHRRKKKGKKDESRFIRLQREEINRIIQDVTMPYPCKKMRREEEGRKGRGSTEYRSIRELARGHPFGQSESSRVMLRNQDVNFIIVNEDGCAGWARVLRTVTRGHVRLRGNTNTGYCDTRCELANNSSHKFEQMTRFRLRVRNATPCFTCLIAFKIVINQSARVGYFPPSSTSNLSKLNLSLSLSGWLSDKLLRRAYREVNFRS